MAQNILITPKSGIPNIAFTGSGVGASPVAIVVNSNSSLQVSSADFPEMMTIYADTGMVHIPNLSAADYGALTLSGNLDDVLITSPVNGTTLIWSSAGNKWVDGVLDHGILTGLSDNDHPQYVLTSVNTTLSSTVSNHIASASVHYPSSVITNYIAAQGFASETDLDNHVNDGTVHYASSVVTSWVTSQGYASATQLNNYVLTSVNNTLSSTVSNHIGSASVHFTVASINHNAISNLTVGNPHTQYATLSGATFTGQVNGTDLDLTGQLTAAKKSFLIEHPTKPGMKLQYACLEGPENSVYVRGKTTSNVIELPDYWTGLVHEDSISVHLTPIGTYTKLNVVDTKDNKVFIESDSEINAFYIVYATRKDVEDLIVEF